MKSKNIIQFVLVGVFMLTLSSFKNANNAALAIQEAKTITAIYDGAESYGYNFVYSNNDDEERTITFQNATENVLKAYHLESDALIGVTMKVTYTITMETEIDEDGFEDEIEVLTITKLEKVK